MMKGKRGLFTVLLVIFSLNHVWSQPDEAYQWEDDRSLFNLSPEEEELPLYFLKKYKRIDYTYDEATQDLVSYVTVHQIIKVNNDNALKQSNRIYIPMRNVLELIDVRSRTIDPNGKIIELDQNNIKEIEDEEAGAGFRIFAVEGATVGGEIEYYYTQKKSPNYFGTETFQSSFPVKVFTFELTCPPNLEFDFIAVNDRKTVRQVGSDEEQNSYLYEAENIPALYNEPFSAYNANKKRLDYKLAYNSVQGDSRLLTWGDAGKRIFNQVATLDKQEEKALDKFYNDLDFLTKDKITNLKKIEHYIKTNFAFDERSGGEANRLDFLLSNKYSSKLGYVRLFVALLEKMEIEYELVVTTDRSDLKFDGKFDSWNYLDDYLLYVTEEEKFFSPNEFFYRYGQVPSGFIATHGLFIKPTIIQNFTYPLARIAYIPEAGHEANFDNLNIDVAFNEDLSSTQINVTRSFLGETATFYKAAYLLSEEERQKELLESVVKYLAQDADIANIEIAELNATGETWELPFVVNGTFSSTGYLEHAGSTILLKAGELIGPQSELYQEQERVMEVENTINRGYDRRITIKIPDGYKVQNPEDINLVEQVFEGERLIFTFEASHELKGNELSIKIIEYYDEIYYPVEGFEDFRRVINAAADWNKVVLVLKKV